jgi:DNA-binding transcriptional LysR family regulator
MQNVSLRRLRVFAAVARHASVSAAARELHLTQPAVSMQVRELEDALGLPLTERIGRRIQLTAAGRELAHHAQQLEAQLRAAQAALDALKGLSGGRIDIGVVSTSKYFAPRLLAEYRRVHPGVELKLAVANRAEVVQWLEANTIDLAIMGTPPKHLACVATRIAEHPLVWLAAPDHPLAEVDPAARGRARHATLDPALLAAESLIVREPGSGTRSGMDRYLAAHRLRPAAMLEMSSNETIKQAVMAGMGIAFLSEHTAGLELATRRLVRLPLAGTPVVRHWYVVHRTERRLLPATVALRAFLLAEGARLIALQMDPQLEPPAADRTALTRAAAATSPSAAVRRPRKRAPARAAA